MIKFNNLSKYNILIIGLIIGIILNKFTFFYVNIVIFLGIMYWTNFGFIELIIFNYNYQMILPFYLQLSQSGLFVFLFLLEYLALLEYLVLLLILLQRLRVILEIPQYLRDYLDYSDY